MRRSRTDASAPSPGGRLPSGEGAEAIDVRAVAAGIIDAKDAAAMAEQRKLVERVVRVDDFDRDLGTALMQQETDAVHPPPNSPIKHRAAA